MTKIVIIGLGERAEVRGFGPYQELSEGGAALVDRLVSCSYEHAPRRQQEVRASLAELEVCGRVRLTYSSASTMVKPAPLYF